MPLPFGSAWTTYGGTWISKRTDNNKQNRSPEDDMPALKRLTQHEVVAIDFANKEVAGDPDSLASIREYLDR